MKSLATCIAATLIFSFLVVPDAEAILIDHFDDVQMASTTTTTFDAVSGGMLGGERDVELNSSDGSFVSFQVLPAGSEGIYGTTTDAQSAASFVTWDGSDGVAAIDFTGLSPATSLTALGEETLRILVTSSDGVSTLRIDVYTDSSNSSFVEVPVGAIATDTAFDVDLANTNVPATAFTSDLGGGADFNNVGAIVLTYTPGATEVDVTIDFIETLDLVGPAEVPEPATLLLLGVGALFVLPTRRRRQRS